MQESQDPSHYISTEAQILSRVTTIHVQIVHLIYVHFTKDCPPFLSDKYSLTKFQTSYQLSNSNTFIANHTADCDYLTLSLNLFLHRNLHIDHLDYS